MPLGTEVGLGPGNIVLDWDPAPPSKRAQQLPHWAHFSAPSSTFGPGLLWPNGWMNQDAIWYGGRPWRRPHCSLPKKEAAEPLPFFGTCLLWPKSSMNQGVTWYRARPQPRRHCVRWGPIFSPEGAQPPIFGRCLLWPNGWTDHDAALYVIIINN